MSVLLPHQWIHNLHHHGSAQPVVVSDTDRQNDEGQSEQEEAPLHGKDGMIMQEARREGFLLEKQLAAKINCVRIFPRNLGNDFNYFFDSIGTNAGVSDGSHTAVMHVSRVAAGFGLDIILETRDFGGAFEISGIDYAHLDKDKIFEDTAKKTRGMEQGVEAQPVETVHEEHGGFRGGLHVQCCRRRGSEWFRFTDANNFIQPTEFGGYVTVMAFDAKRGSNQCP